MIVVWDPYLNQRKHTSAADSIRNLLCEKASVEKNQQIPEPDDVVSQIQQELPSNIPRVQKVGWQLNVTILADLHAARDENHSRVVASIHWLVVSRPGDYCRRINPH
jgi:hypothetical protein